MEFNIALLRGDGIGPEIVDSAVEFYSVSYRRRCN